MAHYNLYDSLRLLRSQSPQDIFNQLEAYIQQGDFFNPGGEEEARIAQAILGNPDKRAVYDQRLDDPSAQTIDVDAIRELAAAPAEAFAGVAQQIYGQQFDPAAPNDSGMDAPKKKLPTTPILISAVAVLAIVMLSFVGIKFLGSDGKENSKAIEVSRETDDQRIDAPTLESWKKDQDGLDRENVKKAKNLAQEILDQPSSDTLGAWLEERRYSGDGVFYKKDEYLSQVNEDWYKVNAIDDPDYSRAGNVLPSVKSQFWSSDAEIGGVSRRGFQPQEMTVMSDGSELFGPYMVTVFDRKNGILGYIDIVVVDGDAYFGAIARSGILPDSAQAWSPYFAKNSVVDLDDSTSNCERVKPEMVEAGFYVEICDASIPGIKWGVQFFDSVDDYMAVHGRLYRNDHEVSDIYSDVYKDDDIEVTFVRINFRDEGWLVLKNLKTGKVVNMGFETKGYAEHFLKEKGVLS